MLEFLRIRGFLFGGGGTVACHPIVMGKTTNKHTTHTYKLRNRYVCIRIKRGHVEREEKILPVPIPKLRSRILGLDILQMTDFKRICRKAHAPSTDFPWRP